VLGTQKVRYVLGDRDQPQIYLRARRAMPETNAPPSA
jgi:hypothetical protein